MVLIESIYSKLKKGQQAPDFNLPATDGKTYSLKDFPNQSLLIVFICNHCPYVVPKIAELKRIQQDHQEITVIGINPNDQNIVPEDDFEHMQEFAEEHQINFIYLRDESQETARNYGASCTPDPFLFNKDHKLIFHSRIDDAHGEAGGNQEMHQAIKEFLETGSITTEEQPSLGCSIKWKK